MVLALWICRRPGPAIAPDSVSYLGAATSMVRHGTLRVPFADWTDADSTAPLTDYAPGYPLALAAPMAMGVPPAAAARWIQAAAIGAATTMAVLLVLASVESAAALFVVPLLLLMPALTDVHLWILSEPLFNVFVVGTLALMARRPERPLAYGTMAAFGNLVRFAGASLVGAAFLWAITRPGGRRMRAQRAALAAAPGLALHLWWRLHDLSPAGGIGGPFTAGLGATLHQGIATVVAWLVPLDVAAPWRGAVAVTIAIGLALATRRAWRSATPVTRDLLAAAALLGGCYLGMLVVARIAVVPDLPFDSRIFAPLLVVAAIAIGTILAARWRDGARATAVVSVAIVVLWSTAAAARDAGTVRMARQFGLGYESTEWQGSPLAIWLRTRGADRTIYTSDPAGTWTLIHRPSRFLPSTLAPDTVAAFGRLFQARPSALVSFPPELAPQAPGDLLATRLGLTAVARTPFGTVWIRP